VWHDSFISITHSYVCDMTHSCPLNYSTHNCVTCLAHKCVIQLIHTREITHSYVWHDSFICATWLIHMCDVTHSSVWHDSFIRVTWLIHLQVSLAKVKELLSLKLQDELSLSLAPESLCLFLPAGAFVSLELLVSLQLLFCLLNCKWTIALPSIANEL